MNTWLDSRTHGYFRVAAARPVLTLGDPQKNAAAHTRMAHQLVMGNNVQLVVFPEMGLTGYTVEDYLGNDTLLDATMDALREVVHESRSLQCIMIVGAPIRVGNVLVNTAIGICNGEILAVWPKSHLPNYREFYDLRWFAGPEKLQSKEITILGQQVPIGNDILIDVPQHPGVVIHAEVCEDGWVPITPSTHAALAGATILCNLSASDYTVGKQEFRREVLLEAQSARLIAAMIYSSCGWGESTRDLVWDGDAYIAENGTLLKQAERFDTNPGAIVADVHPARMLRERRTMNTYQDCAVNGKLMRRVVCDRYLGGSLPEGALQVKASLLRRPLPAFPFVPQEPALRATRSKEVFQAQAMALASRMQSVGITKLVIGVSGGLDSTLALLVAVAAVDMLGLPRENVIAVTMPGFGTTNRTKNNAQELCEALGTTFEVHSIVEEARMAFAAIGHDGVTPDLAYENVQARLRTAHLFHRASMVSALVVGTGDLSEIAQGWCTFMGDHMSSYNVNCSMPKTLIKVIIGWYADEAESDAVQRTLRDIIDTPISPELLPSDANAEESTQLTEEKIGPYELHDFFLYYHVRLGVPASELLFLSHIVFNAKYKLAVIAKWLRSFYWRFVTNQFKRDVVPPGPKLGTVSLSPRGDWRAPPDLGGNPWIDALEQTLSEIGLEVE